MSTVSIDVRLGLSPTARLLLDKLPRLAKGHGECWCGNKALAKILGCCVKTVKNALRALEDAGLIERCRDYHLRSRRRIRLLWVRIGGMFAFMGEDFTPACGQELPPSPVPPLTPHKEERARDDDDFGSETKSSSSFMAQPEQTETPAAERGALLALAETILGAGPPTAAWLDVKIAEFGAALVDHVVRDNATRALTKDNPAGYLQRALETRRAEGGVPPLPPARAAATAVTVPRKPCPEAPPAPRTTADVETDLRGMTALRDAAPTRAQAGWYASCVRRLEAELGALRAVNPGASP